MNLTSYERLMLSLKLRSLAEEDPSYAPQAEIIEQGYTFLYSEVFGSTAEPELPQEVQEEVFDILDMFRALHPGHEVGPDWNPEGNRYYQKFRGFDGNNDPHYGFARFLIEKFGRFEESKSELNSHGPTLSTYRGMFRRWKALGKPSSPTEEQIDGIIGS
ncbi:YfbU family protein [Rhizobium straminoryzae]|nr:YfbU family protein [Rhizobium straminoryzae]